MTTESPDPALLTIEELTVTFGRNGSAVTVVEDVSLAVREGEIHGLVGESGSGKSVTARSVLRLLGPKGRITGGRIRLGGQDLMSLPAAELRRVRGGTASMIFQEPRRSLDPAMRVGAQIAEVARVHLGLDRREARRRAVELLDSVGIPEPERRARAYPHELSGGMCQRSMLAMALAGSPRLLIADEPTTALDTTVQAKVLELIRSIRDAHGMSVLLITHDLSVAAETCDRITVMYAGQIVESGPTEEIFGDAGHPYTRLLLEAVPSHALAARLVEAPAPMPAPGEWPAGCRFRDACPHAEPACADPIDLKHTGDRAVRCIRPTSVALV